MKKVMNEELSRAFGAKLNETAGGLNELNVGAVFGRSLTMSKPRIILPGGVYDRKFEKELKRKAAIMQKEVVLDICKLLLFDELIDYIDRHKEDDGLGEKIIKILTGVMNGEIPEELNECESNNTVIFDKG